MDELNHAHVLGESSELKHLNHELYKKLYLIRRTEEAIRERYVHDMMKTPMHMSMGGEAIAVGVCHTLKPQDEIVGTYRSHGIYLARTGETDRFFAEMYGKATGMAKGKGGSMHLTAPECGLICTSAIVGTTIPVGVGAAFANKQLKNNKIVAIFFGDGAIDEGVFWESLNAACLMKLPVLFICEDNGFAVHTTASARHSYRSITDIVSQFDCDVYKEQSTDAEVIYYLTCKAVTLMKKSQRPAFLHLKYYRYLEHVGVFEDFQAGYRSWDEYEQWLRVDPIQLQRKKLLKWFSESEIQAVERTIDVQVSKSIERAEKAPYPDPEELYEDVLA